MKYLDKYDLCQNGDSHTSIRRPHLRKPGKIKWSLKDRLEAWNMAIEQVRSGSRKKGKGIFLGISYHHSISSWLMQFALNNNRADEKDVENEYRSILIAVQLTIVAKDLNLRREKIVVMMIMHYNQYHDYFGSQSKKLTSAAAALPWMVCSEPRLGSSPQWSTTEET